jgi:hypothetical protein
VSASLDEVYADARRDALALYTAALRGDREGMEVICAAAQAEGAGTLGALCAAVFNMLTEHLEETGISPLEWAAAKQAQMFASEAG